MPVTFTTRFGFPQWSADTDPFVTRAQFDAFLSSIDAEAVIGSHGLASARPAAGVADRIYLATDTGVLSYDTGAAWVTINGPKTYTTHLTWKIAGAPVASSGDELPYPADGPINVPTGQTKTLIAAVVNALGTWTAVPTYKIRRFTAGAWADIPGLGTTAAPLSATGGVVTPTAVALADGDMLGLFVVGAGTPSGAGPWSLRARLRIDATTA